MGHQHAHAHGSAASGFRGRLAVVLLLSCVVLAVEVAGGLVSGSLALLADAGHVATDAAGTGLALFALRVAARPATAQRTYGYYRVEILAAAVNAMLLFAVAGWVFYEASQRFTSRPTVDDPLMLGAATVGLVINLIAVRLLAAGRRESLNVRGAYLEALGDLVGSAAVIVAAALIAGPGWWWADPVASIAIGALILPRTWSLLRDAVAVLLEGTPPGMDLSRVREHILSGSGVLAVHDLHAWTITSGLPVLTAHVVVKDEQLGRDRMECLLDELRECLQGHFDVEHSTFQIEPAGHVDHEEICRS